MGRTKIPVDESRYLLVGIDRPMRTLFAQLWDVEFAEDIDGEPAKAAGYHDAEKTPGAATEYGEYPLDVHAFDRTLREWGMSGEVREAAGAALARQEEIPGEVLEIGGPNG